MVVVELIYKKPIEQVEQYLDEHRQYLQKQYDKGLLLASGPKNPRDGGFIIALASKEVISEVINQDPFKINDIADYKLSEFDPVKHHPALEPLIK